VKSRSEAIKLRSIEDVKIDALFADYEKDGGKQAPLVGSQNHPISLSMVTEYVRSYVSDVDAKNVEKFVADPAESKKIQHDMYVNAGIELSILNNPEDPRQWQWIDHLTAKILKDLGSGCHVGNLLPHIEDAARRALLELQRRKIDRYQDKYDRPFYDTLFDPAKPVSVTFDEVCMMFWQEKELDYKLNKVSKKRSEKIQSIILILKEIIGEKRPVSMIDDDIVQLVRQKVARIPTNKTKKYPNISLDEAIARSEKEGRGSLATLTQAMYLGVFRDVLKLARRKKLLSYIPDDDIKPLKKETLSADKKRLPWTSDQIKSFFEGKFYQSCADGAIKPYSKGDKSWRFWMPLIMLYCGARPNEIAQLHIEDLKQTKTGTWYLNITDIGDDEEVKTLKTESSRRRIPVHTELIKFGFLSFVQERGKQSAIKGARLFWELKPDQYGNFATYPCRRFNEHFIRQEVELEKKQVFYSLRHNFRDMLRQVQAPPETLLAIAGWSPAGTAVSDNYGDPGNPDLHIKWVNKISYSFIDLSFLYK
jgi:integrase